MEVMSLLLVEPVLVRRVVHRHDVLRPHAGLDVVHVVEHVAAARSADRQVAADVLADRFRRRGGEHVLAVDRAALGRRGPQGA